jgi:NAD(P)H-hydrate epimerase
VRSSDGHKGTFGHLLVVAGSTGKCGAAVMAAESGLRGGAGLVTLACPHSVQPAIASRLTEVMTVPMADFKGEISLQAFDRLLALAEGKQALAVGPGLGLGEETGALIRRLVNDSDLPMVIDADGLTALCGHLHILDHQTERTIVLTPHPGEMARLTGLSTLEIQADRFSVARDFAVRHRVVLVLKGARTLTASPDGKVYINTTGHAGLASGGMGDVLTGLIGSLLAQGLSALNAAALGVYLHGLAADQLLATFGDAGLLATDVMFEIPAARQALSRES